MAAAGLLDGRRPRWQPQCDSCGHRGDPALTSWTGSGETSPDAAGAIAPPQRELPPPLSFLGTPGMDRLAPPAAAARRFHRGTLSRRTPPACALYAGQ